jgi:hypothetical protein
MIPPRGGACKGLDESSNSRIKIGRWRKYGIPGNHTIGSRTSEPRRSKVMPEQAIAPV